MQKDKDLKKFEDFFIENAESKFDVRLTHKKIEHGFVSRQERDAYLKALPAETEYDFTSAEALDAESHDEII